MGGWETPFVPSFLTNPNGVVINCPTPEAFDEVCAILEEQEIRYPSGDTVYDDDGWNEYRDDFCFYVRDGGTLRGPKLSTKSKPWSDYTKCTFYTESFADFAPITREDLLSLIQ